MPLAGGAARGLALRQLREQVCRDRRLGRFDKQIGEVFVLPLLLLVAVGRVIPLAIGRGRRLVFGRRVLFLRRQTRGARGQHQPHSSCKIGLFCCRPPFQCRQPARRLASEDERPDAVHPQRVRCRCQRHERGIIQRGDIG